MNTSHLFAAALSGTLSLCAHASVTGLRWVEVDNTVVDPSSDPIAGAAWLANPAGWRTFDLMVVGESTTRLRGFLFGDALRPDFYDYVIYTDGAIFNHPAGGDLRRVDGPIFDIAPLLEFDTYATIGELDERFATDIGLTSDLTDGLVGLRGGASTNNIYAPFFADEGMLRVLRLTVSADFTYLGNFNAPDGLFSSARVLFSEDASGTLQTIEFGLPTVIPSPGALSILAIAGSMAARRRR